ncbi:RNA polymerase sigma factor [Flagellimonas onchidii]|uniref:RNA polymerase sigma factor n=1 Tax=Flagellimonas onchidii TaxID=2562684 RepID=UPI0010A69012|nr:sigma-70 family RNA polymerase sigma factor [Allomuricauda onchidii]
MAKVFEYNLFLIQSLKKGNEDAYVYLVNTYHENLYGYVLSLCNDHELTQDIVQNVFIKTWEFRKKLNPKYPIKSFLIKTAYNEFINQYWKNTSIKELESEFHTSINNIVEETEDTIRQLIGYVKQEIQNLPPKCKKIFLLSKQDGLTNHEIAEHLNLSKRTVETQISKAYKIIRERIGEKANLILFLLFGDRQVYSF